MNRGIISTRYAKALLGFAKTSGVEEPIYEQTKRMSASFMEFPSIKVAVANPILSPSKKLELLFSAAGGEDRISDEFVRFIKFVFDSKRAEHLQSICLIYQELYLKGQNIHRIDLTTALPISESVRGRMIEVTQNAVKGDVALYHKVNPDIIGGFIASWDTYRVDASVRGQLQRVEKSLIDKLIK